MAVGAKRRDYPGDKLARPLDGRPDTVPQHVIAEWLGGPRGLGPGGIRRSDGHADQAYDDVAITVQAMRAVQWSP